MTFSPIISINVTPGVEITTNVPTMTYDELLLTIGPTIFLIKKLYYNASSVAQFLNILQYNIFDGNGNVDGFITVTPYSPVQYSASMVVNFPDPLIVNRQSSLNFNLLPSQLVNFYFYGDRVADQDAIDAAGRVNNFKEVEIVLDDKEFYYKNEQV